MVGDGPNDEEPGSGNGGAGRRWIFLKFVNRCLFSFIKRGEDVVAVADPGQHRLHLHSGPFGVLIWIFEVASYAEGNKLGSLLSPLLTANIFIFFPTARLVLKWPRM